MKKFHTAIILLVIIAVTIVVIGLFARYRPKTENTCIAPAQQTETMYRVLLCI